MTHHELGPLILDVGGEQLDSDDQTLLSDPLVGGVILFSRNYSSVPQLCQLVTEIRKINPRMIIAVDHEGGRVQRFQGDFTAIPAMQRLGALYQRDPQQAYLLAHETGWLMAAELIACGLDISFAPVLDVDDHFSTIIGDRSFSANPKTTLSLATAFITGMHEAGMAVTGKHFPGHGGVSADSHVELPVDERTLDELRSRDLIPFKNLIQALDAIMPAHILFPKIDALPVGFSPYWLQTVLRGQMGYQGVIFSDDLSMEGAVVAGDFGERALKALRAGCTSVLVCNNRAGALAALDALRAHSQEIPKSGLENMRARSQHAWSTLASSRRAQGIRNSLASL